MKKILKKPDDYFYNVVDTFWNNGQTPTECWRHLRVYYGYNFGTNWFGTMWRERYGVKKRHEGKGPSRGRIASPVAPDPFEPVTELPRPLAGGFIEAPDLKRRKLKGKRYVFTAAQNNTHVHKDFLRALQTFCEHNNAELLVSPFTYNKNAWDSHGGLSKEGSQGDGEALWYDPSIVEYLTSESLHVARGLVFCGELDILPTAKAPLTGFDDYTGTRSGIIPHSKMQMRSYATMKYSEPKFLYTTGACTQRNYIERKAGQIATFHHVYGAIYVEIDSDGDWFARQINAGDNGVFYDLGVAYGPGWSGTDILKGQPIVNLGDIHIEKLDEAQMEGALLMLDYLKPEEIFLHDVIDFKHRNHHNISDPYFLAAEYRDRNTVQGNLQQAGRFASGITRYADRITVVPSNHDAAFKRWLREGDAHSDPANARFWHYWNAVLFGAIESGDDKYDVFAEAMRACGGSDPSVTYLKEDESCVRYNIEFGMHGHLGPNGTRGSAAAFRQLGRRANVGHTHSAGIVDGIYTAGVLGSTDMGYNKGPSGWSCSHIITYPNGKRQIVTQRGKKWRAEN